MKKRSLPLRAQLAVAWSILAIGTAGLTFMILILTEGGGTPPFPYFGITIGACVISMIVGTVWLRTIRTKAKEVLERPQLFITDLLTLSFLMAFYFAGASAWLGELTVKSLLGGGALLAAMVLGLFHASRKGFSSGYGRSLWAVGSVLMLLGVGAVGLLAFLNIFAFCIGQYSSFLNWVTGQGSNVLWGGVAGLASLLVGGALWHAARSIALKKS